MMNLHASVLLCISCFWMSVCLADSAASQTLGHNILENGRFSKGAANWHLKHRSALWRVNDASDKLHVDVDGRNKFLRFHPLSAQYEATFASQYLIMPIHSDSDDVAFQTGPVKLSLRVKNPDQFQVHLDLLYTDGSMLNVLLPVESTSSGIWQEFCWLVPAYGPMKTGILHLVHQAPSESEVLVDDVSVQILTQFSGNLLKDCQLYTSSFPKQKQVLQNFLVPIAINLPIYHVYEITLASQMTLDRLEHLRATALQWQGPISAAVFIPKSSSKSEMSKLVKSYYEHEELRKYVTIHLVLEDHLNGEDSSLYPVNYLRDVSISLVETRYVFYVDIDVMPMFTHDQAVSWLGEAQDQFASEVNQWCFSCTFVVPIFHVKDSRDLILPQTKPEVVAAVNSKENKIEIFSGVSHSSVRYKHWFTATEPYEITYMDNMEPYFIVEMNAPVMSPFYAGYGRDKCAYSYDLHQSGFTFIVLPEAFAINRPEQPGSQTIYSRSRGIQLKMFLNILFHHSDVEANGPLSSYDFLTMIGGKKGTSAEEHYSDAPHLKYTEGHQFEASTEEEAEEYEDEDDDDDDDDDDSSDDDEGPADDDEGPADDDEGSADDDEGPADDEEEEEESLDNDTPPSCLSAKLTKQSVAETDLTLIRGKVNPERKDVLMEDLMNTYGTYLYVEFPSSHLDSVMSYMLPMAHPERIVLGMYEDVVDEDQEDGFYWRVKSKQGISQFLDLVKQAYPDSPALWVFNARSLDTDQIVSDTRHILAHGNNSDVIVLNLKGGISMEDVNFVAETVCQIDTDSKLQVYHLRGRDNHFVVIKHSTLSEAPKLPVLEAPGVSLTPMQEDVTSDVILISKNRPLQTLAFLESINKHVRGITKLWLIQKTDESDFISAYEDAIKCAGVYFELEVLRDRGNLGELVMDILRTRSSSKCVMLAVDEMIWLQPVNLKFSCNVLSINQHISTFQLRLGKSLGAYPHGRRAEILLERVHLVDKKKDLYVYNPYHWPYDFGYVLHIDGFFTRRTQVLDDLEAIGHPLTTPGSIENSLITRHLYKYLHQWHLMYGQARFVNNMFLKDGRVVRDQTPSAESLNLLHKFRQEKLKIDVETFEKSYKNLITATHMGLPVEFVNHSCEISP